MELVTLRPHHLVRGVEKYLEYDRGENGGHEGRERFSSDASYGARFHEVAHQILRRIIDDPNITIRTTASWDDFCEVCQRKDGCSYQYEVPGDVEKLTRLGFQIGQEIRSGEVVAKIRRQEELIRCVVDEIMSGSELGKWLQANYGELFPKRTSVFPSDGREPSA